MFKSKPYIFRKFSSSGSRLRTSSGSGKGSLSDPLMWSCPVIDADFVEVNEGPVFDDTGYVETDSELDSELIENLREFLRTRSKEEIDEIFEEIRKILEDRSYEGRFSENSMGSSSAREKVRMKEIPGRAFRTFSKTASCGKARVIRISKTVSSKASTIASGGKESVKVSSKKLNEKWSNLSPSDRKMISEFLIAVIEIGLLRKSTRGKKAAFVVLTSIYRHQSPGRKDLEEFMDEVGRRFKHKH